MENCTVLKYKVQELIQDGKVKFEKLDEQDEVRHSLPIFSRTKEDMTKGRQDDKIKGKGVGCLSTTLKPEKQPHEAVWRKVSLSQFTYRRSDLHFQNGIKLMPDVTIMLETLGIHWRIVLLLSIKYKN